VSRHLIQLDVNDEFFNAINGLCRKHNINRGDVIMQGVGLLNMISEATDDNLRPALVDENNGIANITGLFKSIQTTECDVREIINNNTNANVHKRRLDGIED